MRDRFMYFSCIYFENISNYWETNWLQQNIFGFSKQYIILTPKHYLRNHKVTCTSNIWMKNPQWQLQTQAPSSMPFFSPLIKGQPWIDEKTRHNHMILVQFLASRKAATIWDQVRHDVQHRNKGNIIYDQKNSKKNRSNQCTHRIYGHMNWTFLMSCPGWTK